MQNLPLLLLLCLPASAQLSEDAGPAEVAPTAAAQKSCSDGITAKPGKFCESVEDCFKFCPCACTFDSTKWKKNVSHDGSTVCDGAPKTGPGMIDPDSKELKDLPAFDHLSGSGKATQPVIDGLKRLDEWLRNSKDRSSHRYTVKIKNCYRSHIHDTESECGYVLKAMHMLARVKEEEKRAYWLEKANPQNLGLAWPGNSPHSAGDACDLVLADSAGQDCFDHKAGGDSPTCSIDQKLASKMLDEAVTAAGGRRLNYEAWHYEWGDSTRPSRCTHPTCADKHWPPKGRP